MSSPFVPFSQGNELVGPSHPATPDGSVIAVPGDIDIPRADIQNFLWKELNVERLNVVYDQLWWAGLPGRVQALHHQKVIGRELILTERANLHLVWYGDRIFIKPLPMLLLNHEFFLTNIAPYPNFLKPALGLLFTYTKLIQHASDLSLAQNLGLIPSLDWSSWKRFSDEVSSRIGDDLAERVDKRYQYGELRLKRLNQIYYFCRGEWRAGYFQTHRQYGSFFRDYFGWLVLLFAYESVILSAMQVLLATKQGEGEINGPLNRASLGFGTASIVAVLFILMLMAMLFAAFWLVNGKYAWRRRARRSGDDRHIDIEK
ncbi:hypothetical protein MMC25_006664 [Agyrium rufum]|nr:hypothetical protein [Agyrium rufum]